MTDDQPTLGLEFERRPMPEPGTWIAWARPGMGLVIGRVRSTHPAGLTADRIEVIQAELDRGHATPRTKPHFLDMQRDRVRRARGFDIARG